MKAIESLEIIAFLDGYCTFHYKANFEISVSISVSPAAKAQSVELKWAIFEDLEPLFENPSKEARE